MSSSFFDYLSSCAVSLTVAGNTGISPFLTLLVVGGLEMADPTLLNMGETMESILASWYSIIILTMLTSLELIGKCVPVIDTFIDSVQIFIVPFLSVLGSLGTMGLLDLASISASGTSSVSTDGTSTSAGQERWLMNDGTTGALTFLKVFVVVLGVGLSLCIHLFKMLVRVTGLVCCAGLCQPCITILEVSVVCIGVIVAIFIREIAIITCCLLLVCAIYAIRLKWCQAKDGDAENGTTGHGAVAGGDNSNNNNTTNDANARLNEPGTVATVTAVLVDDGIHPPGNAEVDADSAKKSSMQQSPEQPHDYDEENPPEHPPAPSASSSMPEQVSLSRLTPMAPPGHDEIVESNNNNDGPDAPVAIAVPLPVVNDG